MRCTHNSQPLQILVVDEDWQTAAYLAARLQEQGHRVRCATHPKSAVAAAHFRRFDLLIVGSTESDADGGDLLRQIRTLYPVDAIALAEGRSRHDAATAHEAGFLRCLAKPVRVSALLNAIEETHGATNAAPAGRHFHN